MIDKSLTMLSLGLGALGVLGLVGLGVLELIDLLRIAEGLGFWVWVFAF
jgi:hypothetical protein